MCECDIGITNSVTFEIGLTIVIANVDYRFIVRGD